MNSSHALADEMDRAAAVLRTRSADVASAPGERWKVDHAIDDGVVVGAHTPDDEPHLTAAIAWFRRDDASRPAYEDSRARATLMATLDPVAADALADWLEATAKVWRAGDRPPHGTPAYERDVQALAFTRTLLRARPGELA